MSKRETFSNSIYLDVVYEYDKESVLQIWNVLRHVYHVACRKGPLKHDFLDIFLTTILESIISQIQKRWGSSIFQNIKNLI